MYRRRPSATLFPYTTLFRSTGKAGCSAPHTKKPENGGGGHQGIRAASTDAKPRRGADKVCQIPPAHASFGVNLRSEHSRSEEHTSELQSLRHLVCRLLLEKK